MNDQIINEIIICKKFYSGKKMKIALIGEYSGLHLELARGLEKLGHVAHVYADGDDFKKIESTHSWLGPSIGYVDLAKNLFLRQPKLLKKTLTDYDVVQFINPDLIVAPNHLGKLYLSYLLNTIKASNAIKVLAVVGCDSRVLPIMKALPSTPCPGCLIDMKKPTCPYAEKNRVFRSEMLEHFVDIILPFGSATYAASYAHSVKNKPPIMFPIDLDKIKYQPNIITGGKIVVLHGLNRAGFKGTREIAPVFSRLAEQFPDKFEFILPDRLPFSEYLDLVYRANVIVDQMHVDALGMNSLYSLATGRVVMTCHDKNTNIGSVNLSESPAINVTDQISLEKALMEIVEWSSDDFFRSGENGRNFVITHCKADEVAAEFIKVIGDTL